MVKWLWKFSGDDYRIIADCDKSIKVKFALIGAVVLFLILLSLFSIQIAIESLFQSAFIGLLIGVFFAGVLSILYILLLQTLSYNLLPHIKPKTIENSRWLRYVFIVFIAVIISKPIEYQILKSETIEITNNIKAAQIAKLTLAILKVEQMRLGQIENRLKSEGLSDDIRNSYLSMQTNIIEERKQSLSKAIDLVNNSRYFIKGLQGLHEKHPLIWGMSMISVFIFLLPILIKLSIPRNSEYIQKKQKMEMAIVDEHYESTKELYTQLFWENHKRFAKLHETHSDSPYNTKKIKKERKVLKQADLVKLIYKKK
ncbi:DUF4407 domain-containing protein [Salibacteraceae bacterium]|nr:DUF4407 domain-containing protein [Salibacteraceae bacterium]